jgi:hypothetical protein
MSISTMVTHPPQSVVSFYAGVVRFGLWTTTHDATRRDATARLVRFSDILSILALT